MPEGDARKLDQATLAMVRSRGLEKALAEFPECVAEAARAAALDLADMPTIDGSSEPWPSMRVRVTR
jgi:hypothetical protein